MPGLGAEMRDVYQGRRIVGFGQNLVGARSCSSIAALDPAGTEWTVRATGPNLAPPGEPARYGAADARIAELDKKIEQGRAAERKLPQFREEVRRLELELEKLRRILPSTRNTEEIIKKIKSLVDQGDFALRRLTFPKLGAAKEGDPYAEWPISVSVDGRYHDLAILFNRLSNFSRIMNVEQINISALPDHAPDVRRAAEWLADTG